MKKDSEHSAAARILAMAGAAVLGGLYLLTLVLALTGSRHTTGFLMAALFASMVLPVLIYVYQMVWKKVREEREEK